MNFRYSIVIGALCVSSICSLAYASSSSTPPSPSHSLQQLTTRIADNTKHIASLRSIIDNMEADRHTVLVGLDRERERVAALSQPEQEGALASLSLTMNYVERTLREQESLEQWRLELESSLQRDQAALVQLQQSPVQPEDRACTPDEQ